MEDRDRYDNGAADQLPPDHPDLAAAPHPVDHEDHIGGLTHDDLAVTDALTAGREHTSRHGDVPASNGSGGER